MTTHFQVTWSFPVQAANWEVPSQVNFRDCIPDNLLLPFACPAYLAMAYPADRHVHRVKMPPKAWDSSMDSWASVPFDPSLAYRAIRTLHHCLLHRRMKGIEVVEASGIPNEDSAIGWMGMKVDRLPLEIHRYVRVWDIPEDLDCVRDHDHKTSWLADMPFERPSWLVAEHMGCSRIGTTRMAPMSTAKLLASYST